MSNKKVVASVAASLSLLAAPSTHGLGKWSLLTSSIVVPGTALGVYYAYKAFKDKGIDINAIEEFVSKTFKKCEDGTFEILSGAMKGCRFAVVEIKSGCKRVQKVLISAASEENFLRQLERVQKNGAAIDGDCVKEFSAFFKSILAKEKSFGDKFEEGSEFFINILIRSFFSKFLGYNSIDYINVGLGAFRMAQGDVGYDGIIQNSIL